MSYVDDLHHDVRHAIRQIRRSPGFALLAVLCLGLGVGANTAIFGVITSVLLQPMPVAEPDRLVMIARGEGAAFSYPDFLEVQRRTRVLAGLTATLPMESDLDIDGESSFVAAEVAPGNYAEVMGIAPLLGRWFADDREPVAVISHTVWERRFNLSPQVIGRVIRSESQSYTIVGVAPREFTGALAPMRTDLWVPIQTRPRLAAQLEQPSAAGRMMALFGRLRVGASASQASAELNAIDAQLMAEQGAPPLRPAPLVAESIRGVPNPGSRVLLRRLTTLMTAVVGLVLLIACVNVGNLLLVRGALRRREFAVRDALGASRSRLLRQLLTESLVLGIGGGIAGLILAVWTNTLLERMLPRAVRFFELNVNLSIDWRAVVFAAIVSLVATALCGLLPAWRTSRTRGLMAVQNEIGAGPSRRRPIGLVAQVVMSWVLLFLAGSFLQVLQRLQTTDPGFDATTRLYAYTWIPSTFTPEGAREFYAQALDRVRGVPGVRAAALTSTLPLMPVGSDCVALPAGASIPVTSSEVGSGYFDAMGIGLVAGREFAPADASTDDGAAVVVNETLARRIWPGTSAIGERVMVGCEAGRAAVVVGIVRDSVIRTVGELPQPHVYRRLPPAALSRLTAIMLHTSTTPGTMVQPVRRALLELGQGIRVYTVEPLSVHVEESYAQIRWLAQVLTGFGVLALLLAAVGVHGTIAYQVTLRTREIGVRMALGARRVDVFREVVTHGLAIVLAGVAIGELLTMGFTGLAGALQAGVRPTSVSTHVASGLIWIAVALAACYLPAARASRVDPLVALRHD